MSDSSKEILAFLREHWPKINRDQATLHPWFEQKRKIAETEAALDLQKEIPKLLADIHDESLDDQSRSREMTVSRTMARFGSLLCVLSEKADIQTGRIIRLTWGLVLLTVTLLIFTVYLYRDTHALIEREKTTAPHNAIHP